MADTVTVCSEPVAPSERLVGETVSSTVSDSVSFSVMASVCAVGCFTICSFTAEPDTVTLLPGA